MRQPSGPRCAQVKAARALQQGVFAALQVPVFEPAILGQPELAALNLQAGALVAAQLQQLAGWLACKLNA